MLLVEVFNAHHKRRVHTHAAVGYATRVLRSAGIKRAKLSLVFIGSRYCRKINKTYLGHDFVTDVLSFPLERGRLLEGEIYVNLDRAATQAKEYGVSFSNEVARLVVHGTLHLVGYDDSTERKADVMRVEEERHVRFWFH